MSHDDELVAEIKAAQAAPAADYMLWAVVTDESGGKVELPLESVRLPLTRGPESIVYRLQSQGRLKLIHLGHEQAVDTAEIRLGLIPDMLPILDQAVEKMKHGASDFLLLGFVEWEAAKRQTGLRPVREGSDEEIVSRGLHIRPSAAR